MVVRCGWKRLPAVLIMLAAVLALGRNLGAGPVTTFLQIGGGAAVYFLTLLAMRDRTVLDQLQGLIRKVLG